MYAPTYKTFREKSLKKMKKKANSKKQRAVTKKKAGSPGVPPETCPYIDVVQRMVKDMGAAYQTMYEKGEHNPMVHKLEEQALDVLEFIRSSNETLRDNSLYWYTEYKQLV